MLIGVESAEAGDGGLDFFGPGAGDEDAGAVFEGGAGDREPEAGGTADDENAGAGELVDRDKVWSLGCHGGDSLVGTRTVDVGGNRAILD